MNSNNIVSSIEEAKVEIQEELIASINKEAICPLIRFWLPEERKPEEEILAEDPEIYNIYIFYKYRKNSKKPIIQTIVGIHADSFVNPVFNQFILNLDPKTISEFKVWGKKAARVISNYLKDKNDFYLTEMRFDLIPTDTEKTGFIIPNLPLENVHFARNINDAKSNKTITLPEFLEGYVADMNALADFLAARQIYNQD